MNGVFMRYQLNLLTIIFDDFCFKAGSICWYTMKIHLNIRINNLKGKTGKNVKQGKGRGWWSTVGRTNEPERKKRKAYVNKQGQKKKH